MSTVNWVVMQEWYLLIGYLFSPCIIAWMHPRKKSIKRHLSASVLLMLAYSAILFLNPQAEGVRFLSCMTVIWIGMVLLFRVYLDISWIEAVYHMVRAFFVGDLAASLFWQLDIYVTARTRIHIRPFLLSGIALGILLYFAVIWLMERHFSGEFSDLQIGKKDLIVTLVLGAILYFSANVSYVLPDSPFSTKVLRDTFALRTVTEFGAVAILMAYHMRIIDMQTRLRMQAMENAWKLQEDHYKTYEASVALVNQKYHDLKHQLQLLRASVLTDEKLRYVDDMERELSVYELQNHTGNNVLDTILTAKSMECKRSGICLTCVADGKALSWMNPLDINALFGNLLDNAIECEQRIPDEEKRLIHISVAQGKSCVQIRVRNICEEPIEFKDGLPVTTKSDKRYHGFGIASVQSIVEKYHGSLLMKYEDEWFEVNILLPLNMQ